MVLGHPAYIARIIRLLAVEEKCTFRPCALTRHSAKARLSLPRWHRTTHGCVATARIAAARTSHAATLRRGTNRELVQELVDNNQRWYKTASGRSSLLCGGSPANAVVLSGACSVVVAGLADDAADYFRDVLGIASCPLLNLGAAGKTISDDNLAFRGCLPHLRE